MMPIEKLFLDIQKLTGEAQVSKKRIAELVLPYVATLITRLPCKQRLSLILDRLLVLAEEV